MEQALLHGGLGWTTRFYYWIATKAVCLCAVLVPRPRLSDCPYPKPIVKALHCHAHSDPCLTGNFLCCSCCEKFNLHAGISQRYRSKSRLRHVIPSSRDASARLDYRVT